MLEPQPPLAAGVMERVLEIRRPDRQLMWYYVLASLLAGPFFFIALLPLYFRYHTMRYRFDEEGVSMRWGVLFRREVNLTYARIQDIHLTSNIVERWLGLGEVKVSTASGSTGAEMTIEGLLEFELVRDFLYMKMRGAQDRPTGRAGPASVPGRERGGDELVAALRQVSADLRAVRAAIEKGPRP
jgi:membrane protein YdbS with pleckstrin-like domain